VRRAGLEQISREDIRREALGRTVDAEGAEHVIARLEAGGVLRCHAAKSDGRGRPRRRWEVNPALR
jgi:predicted ArsR family transcriptional regulator